MLLEPRSRSRGGGGSDIAEREQSPLPDSGCGRASNQPAMDDFPASSLGLRPSEVDKQRIALGLSVLRAAA